MGDFAGFLVQIGFLFLFIFLSGVVGIFVIKLLPRQLREFVIEKMELEEIFDDE